MVIKLKHASICLMVTLVGAAKITQCSSTAVKLQAQPGVHQKQFVNKSTSNSPRFVASSLQVPFKILGGGRLVIADPDSGGGMPRESFQKIWLMFTSNKKSIVVDSLDVLRKHVMIRNPSEALAFCRLTTSPSTHFLFGEEVEVVYKDQVTPSYCFGDKKKCGFFRNMNSGIGGVISRSKMRKLKILPATARQVGDCFEVRRTLLIQTSVRKAEFVSVIETITQDGDYRRKVVNKRYAPQEFIVPYYI